MSIIVACECGRKFRARDEHAGKRAKCPACDRPLIIPALRASPAPQLPSIPTHQARTCVVCGDEIPPGLPTVTQEQVICKQCLGDAARRESGTKGLADATHRGKRERAPQILLKTARMLTVAAYCSLILALAASFARLPKPDNVTGPAYWTALVIGVAGWGTGKFASRQKEPSTREPTQSFNYAGFWNRFAAAVVDGLVLLPVTAVYLLLVWKAKPGPYELLVLNVFDLSLVWLYFACMESSTAQATFGKMAAGIRVVDVNGHRISFCRASGRHFGKWVSGGTFFIGFLMAGFTKRKQALHDGMAGCLVVAPFTKPAAPICGLAQWSLCLGLLGIVLVVPLIPAGICGHLALRRIAQSGGTVGGKDRAILGLMITYGCALIWLIWLIPW